MFSMFSDLVDDFFDGFMCLPDEMSDVFHEEEGIIDEQKEKTLHKETGNTEVGLLDMQSIGDMSGKIQH